MREIKFRAWDTKNRHWLPSCWFRALDGGPLIEADEGENGASEWTKDWTKVADQQDYILEQYTGLEDKNGREIYEGDILWQPKNYGTEPLVVIWEAPEFQPFCSYNTIESNYPTAEYCRIIGNIHENPELLK
jgi:uncharacterized phage protein (TIGR01671 family)